MIVRVASCEMVRLVVGARICANALHRVLVELRHSSLHSFKKDCIGVL